MMVKDSRRDPASLDAGQPSPPPVLYFRRGDRNSRLEGHMATSPAGEKMTGDFLLRQIRRAKELRLAHAASPDRAAKRLLLRQWQMARLANTYADLLEGRDTRAAAEFFLNELYGVKDTSKRDDAMERIYPMMQKMLPQAALHSIGLALELDALSEELDAELLDVLGGQLSTGEKLTEDVYVEAFRRCNNYDLRKRQIELVTRIGSDLAVMVKKPLLSRSLRAMRMPARVAGFGELQTFLERGFAAFRSVADPKAFLGTIERRETRILDRIYSREAEPFGRGQK
jgi:hypothetical protein